ncbi:MAG: HNH endonuclease, partial [Bacteroidota bacterium]
FNWEFFEGNGQGDLYYPFFYLRNTSDSERNFWWLKSKTGKDIKKFFSSTKALQADVAYGYFDEELYQILSDDTSRVFILNELVAHFFPEKVDKYKTYGIQPEYFDNWQLSILNEKSDSYGQHTYRQEFRKVRRNIFPRQIVRIYQNKCAVLGNAIFPKSGEKMIDACHIIPVKEGGLDFTGNGIALSPTLHRVFDRGLISINKDYRVILGNNFKEVKSPFFSLQALEGREILLPTRKELYPSQDSLEWHRTHIFNQ